MKWSVVEWSSGAGSKQPVGQQLCWWCRVNFSRVFSWAPASWLVVVLAVLCCAVLCCALVTSASFFSSSSCSHGLGWLGCSGVAGGFFLLGFPAAGLACAAPLFLIFPPAALTGWLSDDGVCCLLAWPGLCCALVPFSIASSSLREQAACSAVERVFSPCCWAGWW